VNPHFEVTNANAPAVAEICVRLDGLPLAIELAAARIKLFHPSALLGRLDHRLTVLTGGARDRPSRQQTLRNTIEWSHSLLSDQEQALFARLSVFAGGWTFETAGTVCNPDPAFDVLNDMTSLVEKSLVRREDSEEPRFSLLETIREYAAEKLEARGETEAMRRRHAEIFLDFAEEMGHGFRGSGNRAVWLNRFAGEHDNLRAALAWLLAGDDAERSLRLAGAIWIFWSERNFFAEGQRWLEAALALAGPASTTSRALALRGAAALTHLQGDVQHVRQYGEESLALYREAENTEGEMNR
jgi:predicted ATPase